MNESENLPENENLPEKITEGKASGKTAGRVLGDLIPTATVGTLFVVILMLVVFSAVSYQRSVSVNDMNNNTRAVLSYVTTAVKSNEGSEIRLENEGGVSVLSIADEESGYVQRIFGKDGKVLETYMVTGEAPVEADAIEIGQSELFEMELNEGLLTIRTDFGTSYVRVP
jgi:hypothetical protein